MWAREGRLDVRFGGRNLSLHHGHMAWIPAQVTHEATLLGDGELMCLFADTRLRPTGDRWVAEATPDVEVADGGLPAGLMVILQLDDTDHGPLSPHEIATICNFDRDDILQYLRVSEEQELSWRSFIYDALAREDEEEAAACEHEEKAWSATVKSLREALRLVVLTSRLDEVR